MNTLRHRSGAAAALVATAVLVAGCSGQPAAPQSAPTAPSRTAPSPTAPSPTAPTAAASTARGPAPAAHPRAVRAVTSEVQDYLDEWVAHGITRASRHMVPEQRAQSDEGMPRLVSGRVTSSGLSAWHGPDRLTVQVSMLLRFGGASLAWNRGSNDRFVTATRGDHDRYLLAFATSP